MFVVWREETYLVEQTGAKNYIETPQTEEVLRLLEEKHQKEIKQEGCSKFDPLICELKI